MTEWTPNWTASTGMDRAKPAYVRVFDYPKGYYGNFHRHHFAQLVYSLRGVATVYSNTGRWMAAPLRAVIIPAWENHRVSAQGNTLLHSLFIDPDVYPDTITAFGIVPISSLLHSLIQEAGRYYTDYQDDSLEQRILELIVDLVRRCEIDVNIRQLPHIEHPRIRKAIETSSTDKLRSAEIANRAALSPRQFARIFKQETGMTFKDWRAMYQTQQGMALLQQGYNVSEVASQLGFSSASAFITLFKKNTGTTPSVLQTNLG